jgi:hypothetical protein
VVDATEDVAGVAADFPQWRIRERWFIGSGPDAGR